jgi:hypothetical protein
MIPRRKFHRFLFTLAGFYNIAWGIFTSLDPQWLFRFSKIPDINYPQIFQCLAMVIALYGLLYWEVARLPQQNWPIAAVGLLGKILGPIGMIYMITTHQWPPKIMILCLTNDVIWWLPFALYLHDSYKLHHPSPHSPPVQS